VPPTAPTPRRAVSLAPAVRVELVQNSRLGERPGSARLHQGKTVAKRPDTHCGNLDGSGAESSGRSLDNLFRTYDPATGRYLEADVTIQHLPIASTRVHPYACSESDPVNHFDPIGLLSIVVPPFVPPRSGSNVTFSSTSREGIVYDQSDGTLTYYDAEGRPVAQTSGATSGPYGGGPLPPGEYEGEPRGGSNAPTVGGQRNRAYCDPVGNCWFAPISPILDTPRSGFGIHPDGNVPGTEGCIGLTQRNTSGDRSRIQKFAPGFGILAAP
jgi:RHS repeat-associated protein